MTHLLIRVNGVDQFNGVVEELRTSKSRTAMSVEASFLETAAEGAPGKTGSTFDHLVDELFEEAALVVEEFKEGKFWKWLRDRK